MIRFYKHVQTCFGILKIFDDDDYKVIPWIASSKSSDQKFSDVIYGCFLWELLAVTKKQKFWSPFSFSKRSQKKSRKQRLRTCPNHPNWFRRPWFYTQCGPTLMKSQFQKMFHILSFVKTFASSNACY